MTKRWKIKDKPNPNTVQQLCNELGINKTLSGILAQRGVNNFNEAKYFFRPNLSHLHNPFLMKGMQYAIDRIDKAINNNESVLIYGDYDVDGTTAVALVYTFLKKICKNIDYYIPDRYSEGYGISFQGIDWAKQNGYSLIIALDCGIKSIDKVDYANKQNIDFIICDHHLPGTEIPNAVAVLDPKQPGCNYPYKELSGCGIGLKLVQAYIIQHQLPIEDLVSYLDLAVVSIASDIVPVTGENRIIAYYGLKQFNENPRPGFKAMLELANIKRELTVSDLVFIIGPRINAAGRIENGKKAVELLISDNSASALLSGESINITNTQRRNLDVKITEHALSMVDNNQELINRKTTVLFHNEWHKGVIGIVASRLTEKYYRPTIILTESNGMATGSARSVKNYDVHAAIEACSHLVEQFGGHKFAAGLTLKLENVKQFQEEFEKVVCSTIEDDMLIPEIEIDSTLQLKDIDQKFLRILKQLAPFGPGNMSPVFLTENVIDSGNVCIVGSNHLKLNIQDKANPSETFAAIAFGMGNLFKDIYEQKPFNVCYSIEEHEWNGKTTLQLNVKDIKFTSSVSQ